MNGIEQVKQDKKLPDDRTSLWRLSPPEVIQFKYVTNRKSVGKKHPVARGQVFSEGTDFKSRQVYRPRSGIRCL